MTDKKTDCRISVGLIGAGAMGGALLRGWLEQGVIDARGSAVFDPELDDTTTALASRYGFALNPDIFSSGGRFDALVVAVKPQIATTVLAPFAPIAEDGLVVSVMAGASIKTVRQAIGGSARVARVMPNLPSAIGKGVSGLFAPAAIGADQRGIIEALMRAVGDAVWVDSEQAIDFVTAVSGSGPAYFFLLVEALAEAGTAIGLAPAAAERLARATLIGAGALIEQETRSAAQMRKAVTSPGGTTDAALGVLAGDEKKLRALMKSAVAAAAKRAGELTG
jgi:pyrroline-5-carboxylate reductase